MRIQRTPPGMSSTPCAQPVSSSSSRPDTYHARAAAARRTAQISAASEPYGIDWTAIRAGSVIVDVGGGLGTSCLSLANAYPHLRFVVQDTWDKGTDAQLAHAYSFASNGRVSFQVHDIFDPQPVRTAAIFVLNHIAPRLSDADVRRAFACLRLAAEPSTQLVLIDDEHEGDRTARLISLLLKSAGWGVTTVLTDSGRTHTLRTVFAAPV